ncbi:UDP-N-acetylglucosamine 2-epimerase (non-hydrolyzing) [Tianweitania sp. BSSL-BM11]|uniref:UDP-N-acetylglucosamine 2-epimerase (Non-hydrolyzing) n=1 Tax=Tianweitania aestuarii TaxID=2814886 RepID=A0ABS5RQX8_9HYPH|nr:UDP-N-acetylglucosamine 2-epimerase (non-hydrolyzing) [Tianweitania aestuarii]MBS9719453.1 UDP-N-acetylglucosamine 2-epimerase (non-hydrolyzing) [Tianweitania aestuarii]
MPLIDIIAGARPNFVKIAPIIQALETHRAAGGPLRYRLVHTGQHYDAALSQSFFDELGLPDPDINLGAGPGTPAEQTGAIMIGYETLLGQAPSDCCLVVGDVTSTIACALTARKAGIPVGHVEGGIRSGDWTMPEENNRLATDAITNWFFTTSEHANENLIASGVASERIIFVGNTMIDTLLVNLDRLTSPPFWHSLNLAPQNYVVLTLHRPPNVDDPRALSALLDQIATATRGLPVIFPVHPRTKRMLAAIDTLPASIHAVAPQPYLAFNCLVRHAKAVITDSGGVTEEATVLHVPCMTLRTTTERPETVTIGTNEVLGTDPARLIEALDRLFAGRWKTGAIPPLWDGQAGQRIVSALARLLAP